MGTWGPGTFENDDAMDFVGELAEMPEGRGTPDEPGRVGMVIGLLLHVAHCAGEDISVYGDEGDDEPQPLEMFEAIRALVAAEIVAAAWGRPCDELNPTSQTNADDDDAEEPLAVLARWCAKKGSKDKDLKRRDAKSLARDCVAHIRDEGELAEAWEEATPDDSQEWRSKLEELIERLA